MGGYGGFPALQIRPVESPLDQYAKVQQIQAGAQQLQAGQLENQQRIQDLQDRDALTKALASWDGKNYADIPALVTQAGGSGTARLKIQSQVLDSQAKAAGIAKDDAMANSSNADAQMKQNDMYRGRILNVVSIADPAAKQAAWDAEITKEEQAQKVQPGQVSHTYPGDMVALHVANGFAAGSQIIKEQQETQKAAIDAWKPAAGRLQNVITGQTMGDLNSDKIGMLNQGLQARYQVLNPGKPLPAISRSSLTPRRRILPTSTKSWSRQKSQTARSSSKD